MKSNPLFHLACITATLVALALFILILWLAAALPGWVVFPLVVAAIAVLLYMYWCDLAEPETKSNRR